MFWQFFLVWVIKSLCFCEYYRNSKRVILRFSTHIHSLSLSLSFTRSLSQFHSVVVWVLCIPLSDALYLSTSSHKSTHTHSEKQLNFLLKKTKKKIQKINGYLLTYIRCSKKALLSVFKLIQFMLGTQQFAQ